MKGEGTSELEFWGTSEVDWIWTGSLGRQNEELVSGSMVGLKELERKVGDERIWEDGETLERIKREAPE